MTFSSKRGTITALEDIDLHVADGEFVSIVRPFRLRQVDAAEGGRRADRATAGEVRLRGKPVRGPQRDIGFVFQRAALLEWRSVRKNILLQAEMRGMPRQAAQRRATTSSR